MFDIWCVYSTERRKLLKRAFFIKGRINVWLSWVGIWLNRGYTGHVHIYEFNLINRNARLYDPTLGRFIAVDNYVQGVSNSQGYNRYSYCLNNPLKYTDPDGEWINFVLGAIMGGYSGYQIGKSLGKTGWDLVGYTWAGSSIGFLTAGIGSYVGGAIAGSGFAGASALGYTIGGATAGAFSGASFSALAGGNGLDGFWKGALTGSIGGFVSGGIGGSTGAFIGGATSGAIGTALNNGNTDEIILNAAVGGFFSLGVYELSTYYNYTSNYKGYLSYGGYHKANAAFARANFWEAEASWYETQEGRVSGIRYGKPLGKEAPFNRNAPKNARYLVHTHARFGNGFEYSGPTDIERYQILSGDYDFKTYGYKNSYTLCRQQVDNLDIDLMYDFMFDSGGDKYSNYGNWSNKYGINSGGNIHGLKLFTFNSFWNGW